MHNRSILLLSLCCALRGFCAPAPDSKTAGEHGHHTPGPTNVFNLTVPAHPYDTILARPEATRITVSVLAYEELEGFITFGAQQETAASRTPSRRFEKGIPVELQLGPLSPNTRYTWRFHSRKPGTAAFSPGIEGAFHTARPPGERFLFTLTADAHLDEHTSPDVYLGTLTDILAESPDFHIDLGNLFMTDKHATRDEALRQYLAQRYYLGRIGGSVPIFLALGTHDGERAKDDDGTRDSLAPWSNATRKRYFPNPLPGGFYSGNTTPDPRSGPLQNYYSWQWGDALFVVLDPFRYSGRERGSEDGWGWSLGETQYRWLQSTLEKSRARFKFVFIHNLLVGDRAARGGVEVAAFNEWGGANPGGGDGFKQNRPGWTSPIHPLLVRTHVSAVFKAHDNFYARQELDGILYLMVPQPSFAGNDRIRDLENYGYKRGTFLGNSGHVRVTVTAEKATVDYVKSASNQVIADTVDVRPGMSAKPEAK